MPGKCRPSLMSKPLNNVMCSNLSKTDKECIKAVFEKYSAYAEADVLGRLIMLPEDGMIYHRERAGGAIWVGNKPIRDVVFECGWGFGTIRWSLVNDIGNTAFFSRAEAEASIKEKGND